MAAVEVTITGMLYDKINRTTQNVVLIGEASLTGLGVGGGPIVPPSGGGGHPPGPVDPGWGFPVEGRPHPEHPIYYPPLVPPSLVPPEPVVPGAPTTPVPPPAGTAGWPVTGIVPPPYIVVYYPGIGPVTVALPVGASPTK